MNQNTPSASQIIGKPAKKPRRKHGLGPLQAKWLCKENVVWPQPPGLPLDQVNALMIRLMQEDMDAIEPLRKIMADAAVPLFELIWTDPTLDLLDMKYTVLDMLMNANCLDVLVALSNIARNECYPAYEHVLESQLWLLVLPFHGSKVICERAFEVFKRIAPPQSEAQALAMYEYKKLDQIPVIGKIWKDAADTFLIVHGRTEIATATASPRPTSGPSKKSFKRL